MLWRIRFKTENGSDILIFFMLFEIFYKVPLVHFNCKYYKMLVTQNLNDNTSQQKQISLNWRMKAVD